MVVVSPFFVPDTPPTKKSPVFLYTHDGFNKPYPFEPTIVVGIDQAADQKWDCISAMPSQFGDEHSWQASTGSDVPSGEAERKAYLLDRVKRRNQALADQYRDRLIALYGQEKGTQIQYAEAFELCQYGSQVDEQTLKQLFPGFDE